MRSTPWSDVVRFATLDGYIYLKHTPAQLALEAPVIKMLHDQFHARVPIIIAHHTEFNCFLMKDAGRPLRESLNQQFDAALFCKAIEQFTALQLATADHVDVFLNIGVPDWRLNKLPDLYKTLLSQKKILIEDGLSELDIHELKTLLPKVSNCCKKLSEYPIKQTVVQPDFNDNNILIDDRSKDITIIDLGEIVISHPFFSLVNCLHQIEKHHGLAVKKDMYQRMMDACLNNDMNLDSKKYLDAFKIAQTLWFVYCALADYRLRLACDPAKFMSFQMHGRLYDSLKKLISACHAIDSSASKLKREIKHCRKN